MTRGLKLNYITSGFMQNQLNARFIDSRKNRAPGHISELNGTNMQIQFSFCLACSLKATGNNKALEMESGMPEKNSTSTI